MAHLIKIDPAGRVFVDGSPLPASFTRHEAMLLLAIVSTEFVATKEQLLNAVYGGRDEPEAKIIDVFVCKIRHKLGEHRGAVETIWGRGYGRGAGYEFDIPANRISVQVDIDLADKVAFAADEPITPLVNRLLREELARVWKTKAVA